MNFAGIDVGNKELVIVVSINGKTGKAKTYENTAFGHKAIIQLLSKLKGETRVCLEATGIYHLDLAVVLSRAEDIEPMVINPKVSHNFAQVLMKRSKTDAVDAKTLAVYCEKMPFEAWQRPADEHLMLKSISRRIAALSKQKAQTKNQLHALKATTETAAIVIEHTEELIEVLEKQIQAKLLHKKLLKEKNINSKIVGLDGHVVATAQVDKMQNQWWVLDSDYGVIIPHNLREIEHNPKLISTYYSQAGYDKNKINKCPLFIFFSCTNKKRYLLHINKKEKTNIS